MVIWPAFRMGQYRVDDHPYHAPQFITRTVRDKNFKKDISSLRYELLELNKNYSSQMQTVIGLVNELKAANRTNNRRQSN